MCPATAVYQDETEQYIQHLVSYCHNHTPPSFELKTRKVKLILRFGEEHCPVLWILSPPPFRSCRRRYYNTSPLGTDSCEQSPFQHTSIQTYRGVSLNAVNLIAPLLNSWQAVTLRSTCDKKTEETARLRVEQVPSFLPGNFDRLVQLCLVSSFPRSTRLRKCIGIDSERERINVDGPDVQSGCSARTPSKDNFSERRCFVEFWSWRKSTGSHCSVLGPIISILGLDPRDADLRISHHTDTSTCTLHSTTSF